MTSQTAQQIITIHTWPNISKDKGNQSKKFDQLIQHNMRNTFLKNQAKNCGEDSPRPLNSKIK